ncbi:MAG: hypothetical protein HYV95_09290 [Opitutae bacterium]|nr:hypothetical protein [Opitutae bacterium]
MATPTPPRGSTVQVSTTLPPPPPPPPRPQFNASLKSTNDVLELTSLNSNGGQPSRLVNLNYANFISNTNLGAQNAVANQQAHAQLAVSILGKASNKVANLSPIEGRASVDVLTDNAVADDIASLRAVTEAFSGGGGRPVNPAQWVHLLRIIRRLLREIQHIMNVNARLQGSGTLEDPYRIMDHGPLYVLDPITLGFPGVPADQVKFTPTTQGVQIGG